MANGLTKITTRTGDDGSTGLGDGSRVPKHNVRIEAMGEIDELNSAIGTAVAEPLSDRVRDVLVDIQHDLFDLRGEICIPGRVALTHSHVARLDDVSSEFSASVPPLKEFILPGGCQAAALTHVARAICRRAERRMTQLADTEQVSSTSLKYVNRLSDLLFQSSRVINRDAGVPDIYWQPGRNVDKIN